ncbi:MAG: hypothetical protein AB7Q45_27300, partial [Planctomycetaceae bacterium]
RMRIRIDDFYRPNGRGLARTATVAAVCLLVAGCQLWNGSPNRSCNNGRCQDCADGTCGPLCCVSCEHYSRCIDEEFATFEAIRRANRSLRKCYDSTPSFDFKDGYRQAFVDVAMGGTGQVPAVPPERYWSTCYRTAAGHQRAQTWYAGYVAGAARAVTMCRYEFNDAPTSGVPQVEEEPSLLRSAGPIPAGAPSLWADEYPPQW